MSKCFTLLLVLLTAVVLAACGNGVTYRHGVVDTSQVRYRAPSPGDGWETINTENADLAFWNSSLAAFIMLNSTCDEYRDAPVDALANHLFIGIEKKKFVVQERRPVSGRMAAYNEVTGWLDGAPVRVAAYTVIKNYCTYDLSYSAPPPVFDKGRGAFENVVKEFLIIKRK